MTEVRVVTTGTDTLLALPGNRVVVQIFASTPAGLTLNLRLVDPLAYPPTPGIRAGNLIFAIQAFDGISQDAVKANGPSWIDRRYCTATAWLSNGKSSEVVYLIEATQGFASIGWNVQSCLPGYDRWRIYDAWCRSIRP